MASDRSFDCCDGTGVMDQDLQDIIGSYANMQCLLDFRHAANAVRESGIRLIMPGKHPIKYQ
jgi:hypothetical protein